MHYSNITISALKTLEDCYKATDSINSDPVNIVGGARAFYSGYCTELLKGAQNKLDAIERKYERLFIKQIKVLYKEYVKQGGGLSFEEYEDQEMYC